MTTGIIIQARMTSHRFPGKVMTLLRGKPVLEHVINRSRQVDFVDEVIVAYPKGNVSKPIAELCDRLGVSTYAGPEDDVLGRYCEAAILHDLDNIVRITADCPFLNPLVCGLVVHSLLEDDMDYVSNAWPDRTFPKGYDCEAFTWETLSSASLNASDDSDREHVTPWMQRCKIIRKMNIRQDQDQSDINLCVDYPTDIMRLEKGILHDVVLH